MTCLRLSCFFSLEAPPGTQNVARAPEITRNEALRVLGMNNTYNVHSCAMAEVIISRQRKYEMIAFYRLRLSSQEAPPDTHTHDDVTQTPAIIRNICNAGVTTNAHAQDKGKHVIAVLLLYI